MPVAEAHPSAEELTAFTRGALADDAHASVEAHVAACPTCQAQAAGDSGDTLVELLRRAHGRMVGHQEAVTEGGAQSQTPAPLAAATEAVTLAPAGAGDTGTVEAVPMELAQHERYRVVRLLGAGGMGSVFEAEHRVMRRPVAVKFINRAYTANPAAVERFRREVQAAARLAHPNIVTAHDAENVGDTHFLVMEYVEGKSLGRVLKESGPLPVREACDYVRQAALGLQHAHERGMVHRDVKPDNLMLTPDGTVKVLDFGLAALTAERGAGGLTEANVIMGTPDYMAPEQAEDPRTADTRADVYSLGCTLYQLLTGCLPYPAATSLLKVLAHRERPVPSVRALRPDVPKELEAVLRRLLAKKPEERYQAPGEAAAALAPFALPPADPPKKRNRRPIAVLAALLLAGITVAGVVVYRIQTDKGELVITTESDDVEVTVKQGGKLVRIIDTKTDKTITLDSGTYDLGLNGAPDGLKLNIDKATLTRGETVLAKIERLTKSNVTTISLLRYLPLKDHDQGRRVNFSPDGRFCTAAVAEKPRGAPGKFQGYWVWDVSTGKLLHQLNGFGMADSGCLFSPDGTQLMGFGVKDGSKWELVRWDVSTGQRLGSFPLATDRFDMLAVSPDGRWLVVFVPGPDWTFGASINVYDLKTGKVTSRIDALHPKSILLQRAWFTPDGQLMTSDLDPKAGKSTLRFLDAETGKVARALEFDARLVGPISLVEGGSVACAPYTNAPDPDADLFLGFWAVADGKLLRTVKVGADSNIIKTLGSPTLSGDGRFLASLYPKEHTVRFFELASGTEAFAFDKLSNPSLLSFSRDGRYAACQAADGVYIFRLPGAPVSKHKP